MPKGYFVLQFSMTDPDTYLEYRKIAQGISATYGGRIIVGKQSQRKSMEGGWNPEVFIIVEFDSLEAAENWYHSEGYQRSLPYRLASTNSLALMAEEQP